MTKALLRFVAITFIGLFVLISASVVIGRRRTPTESLALLQLDHCAPPCWIGIIPGTTTLNEARVTINDLYNRSDNGFSASFFPVMNGLEVTLHGDTDRTLMSRQVVVTIEASDYSNEAPVRSITFRLDSLPNNELTLPELVNGLGLPPQVYGVFKLNRGIYNLALNAPIGVLIYSPAQRLEWNIRPLRLSFIAPVEADVRRSLLAPKWRGFTTFRRYGE